MRRYCLFVVSLVVALVAARPAPAVLQFYTVFKTEYLDKHPDKKYAEALTKASDRCYICHQGKNRKHHNVFGQPLVDMLDRKKDLRDKKKVADAIAKVVKLHVDPKDEKSETYMDRIKASKWPGGELAELKKEPPEEKKAE
jgi:hypothetical protein